MISKEKRVGLNKQIITILKKYFSIKSPKKVNIFDFVILNRKKLFIKINIDPFNDDSFTDYIPVLVEILYDLNYFSKNGNPLLTILLVKKAGENYTIQNINHIRLILRFHQIYQLIEDLLTTVNYASSEGIEKQLNENENENIKFLNEDGFDLQSLFLISEVSFYYEFLFDIQTDFIDGLREKVNKDITRIINEFNLK